MKVQLESTKSGMINQEKNSKKQPENTKKTILLPITELLPKLPILTSLSALKG